MSAAGVEADGSVRRHEYCPCLASEYPSGSDQTAFVWLCHRLLPAVAQLDVLNLIFKQCADKLQVRRVVVHRHHGHRNLAFIWQLEFYCSGGNIRLTQAAIGRVSVLTRHAAAPPCFNFQR